MIRESIEYPEHIGVSDVTTLSREQMMVEMFMEGQSSCMADEPLGFDIGEPAALRGQSRGWTPVHYQLGALATCTSITIAVVAQDLGFQLGGLRTTIRSLIDIRGFCDGDTSRKPEYELVEFDLSLDTGENEERVRELALEADRRCPQLGLFHRASIPMHVRWLRKRDGATVFEQRHHLPDGPTPAETLAVQPEPVA
ncbi:MAG: OsmC family protein [Solirubrobacterales bacterium]|nr:OsmC family protein [Solirubrobacterales bacterium]MBV9801321.1 OsmC family protein [Solirubrobacterales bacterium]